MSFTVTKLDRRHSGVEFFTYFITEQGGDYRGNCVKFQVWREWAQDTWGHGCDRSWSHALKRAGREPYKWGWYTDENKVGRHPRLYLKSDEELTLFKLKWS